MGADQLRQTTTGESLLHKKSFQKRWLKAAGRCNRWMLHLPAVVLGYIFLLGLVHFLEGAPHGICGVIAGAVELKNDVRKAAFRHLICVHCEDQGVFYCFALFHGAVEEGVKPFFAASVLGLA